MSDLEELMELVGVSAEELAEEIGMDLMDMEEDDLFEYIMNHYVE